MIHSYTTLFFAKKNKQLYNNYIKKFEDVSKLISKEYEIQQDLNLLCNAYSDFDNTLSINIKNDLVNGYNNEIIEIPSSSNGDDKKIKLTL